jgi:mannan endo-1,4-beta-mannosidase
VLTDFQHAEKYVKTIVSRYKSSPNVFAWELANEARCGGTRAGSAGCAPSAGGTTLNSWYSAQSKFIKSIDPYVPLLAQSLARIADINDPSYHMVTKGGEGWFYITNSTQNCYFDACVYDYSFNGGPGEDFVGDLKIPTVRHPLPRDRARLPLGHG